MDTNIKNAIYAMAQLHYPNLTLDSMLKAFAMANNSEEQESGRQPLLKVKEAAILLGISRQHIYKLAECGELQRINVGIEKNLFRITAESIDAFILRRAGI